MFKKYFYFISILFIYLSFHKIYAAPGDGPTDPYATMNYSSAFNTEILKEFSDILEIEKVNFSPDQPTPPGCLSGITSAVSSGFSAIVGNLKTCFCGAPDLESDWGVRRSSLPLDQVALETGVSSDYSPLRMEENAPPQHAPPPQFQPPHSKRQLSYEEYLARRKLMTDILLYQLYSEKRVASWRLTINAAGGIAVSLPVASLGFGIASALPPSQQALALWPLMDMIYKVSDVLRAAAISGIYKLLPVNDPLFKLEEEFAKRLPYATVEEREDIIGEFGTVRLGLSLGQTSARRSLKVRVGLVKSGELSRSEYARFYPNAPGSESVLAAAIGRSDGDRVRKFVKDFFSGYINADEARNKVAGALEGYVKKLRGMDTGAYTLLLQGKFGLGKTYFAWKIQEFLTGLMDDGKEFPYKLISYTSKDGLLGTHDSPGVLLKAIASIPERYGIMFLDETKLDDLEEIAKLLFDTSGIDYPFPFLGGDVTRSLNPYFNMVGSNNLLKDNAIRSRVVVVDFPEPNRETVERTVKEWLKKNLTEAGASEPEDEVFNYFVKNDLIQEIIETAHHLRLRDMVNTAVAAIRYAKEKAVIRIRIEKEQDDSQAREEQVRLEVLTARREGIDALKNKLRERKIREDQIRNPVIQGLMGADGFWEMSEDQRIRQIEEKINSPGFGHWLKKMTKNAPQLYNANKSRDKGE